MKYIFAAAISLALVACSSEPAPAPEATVDTTPAESLAPAPATPAPVSSNTLTLEGLGALKVGAVLPEGSSWAVRGAQASDTCLIASSPDYPGAYAIVENDKVQRISVGERSNVKLIEGIGVGAEEKAVTGAFPGFRSEPHKYVDAPAKYLTAPNAASGDAALRFEIDDKGKVSQMHVGMMPVLGYVEACS